MSIGVQQQMAFASFYAEYSASKVETRLLMLIPTVYHTYAVQVMTNMFVNLY